ncbi:hypothetical protein BU26DRAFT_522568 [Trematosphaeria pertusa]|uniref:Uncharacterized protein n=1 Tax=Trematosphaeria pertusa TaxID=390896 RepID=A0A6A6I5H7_9PLEO|nr:uncharacterized protein BU26DRAFT_522568 [Trematosphaeria pertusa]KAF2244820.1 hypothetical protein BU26DRAFT_522568 [Trematosphaeria pertusa]
MDRVCHLFRLPGELRNIIYAYALSEDDGLRCVEGKRYLEGERRVEGERGKQMLVSTPKVRAFEVQKAEKTQFGEPGLPLGIGGMIKKAKKEGMRIKYFREANQLQYVNRQLRQETRGFGLRCNDLSFLGDDDATSVERFAKFLDIRTFSHASSAMKRLVRDPTAWAKVKGFGINHPGARINIRIPHLRLSPSFSNRVDHVPLYFLLEITSFLILARNDTRPDPLSTGMPLMKLLAETHQPKNGRATAYWASVPSNVRFWPHEEVFDEVAFGEICSAIGAPTLANFRGGLEGMVHLFRRLYREGF